MRLQHLVDLAGCARCAASSSSRSRSHSATKAFFAPRLNSDAPHRRLHLARPRRAGGRWTGRPARPCSMRGVHRRAAPAAARCSARTRAVSASTRSSIMRTLALLLPRRPRSSSICSASWRRRSPRRRRDLRLDLLRGLAARPARAPRGAAAAAASPSASSSAGRRLSARPSSSPATRAASAWRADSGNTRVASARRACAAVSARCCSICASTCFGAWPAGRPARRSCSAPRSASAHWRAEVVAPDRQVGLGDAGVGAAG